MSDKKPKDYLMGEAAYNAFYQQQPQVKFEYMSHRYQMIWVGVAREVIALHDGYKRGSYTTKKKFKGSEHQRAQWRAQKKRSLEKAATKKSG